MSEKALKDLNMLPESGRKNKNTSNGSLKPEIEQTGENLEDSQKKVSSPGVENPMNVNGVGDSVPEVGNSEVEYIESENMKDVEDLEMSLKVYVYTDHFAIIQSRCPIPSLITDSRFS